MKKLLQFINEYYESKNMYRGLLYYDQEDGYFTDHSRYDIHHSFIISKKFGFIEWLVREDKIDDGLFSNIMVESELFNNIADLTESDCLIMYLSIQDNPIDFLVSVLK